MKKISISILVMTFLAADYALAIACPSSQEVGDWLSESPTDLSQLKLGQSMLMLKHGDGTAVWILQAIEPQINLSKSPESIEEIILSTAQERNLSQCAYSLTYSSRNLYLPPTKVNILFVRRELPYAQKLSSLASFRDSVDGAMTDLFSAEIGSFRIHPFLGRFAWTIKVSTMEEIPFKHELIPPQALVSQEKYQSAEQKFVDEWRKLAKTTTSSTTTSWTGQKSKAPVLGLLPPSTSYSPYCSGEIATSQPTLHRSKLGLLPAQPLSISSISSSFVHTMPYFQQDASLAESKLESQPPCSYLVRLSTSDENTYVLMLKRSEEWVQKQKVASGETYSPYFNVRLKPSEIENQESLQNAINVYVEECQREENVN